MTPRGITPAVIDFSDPAAPRSPVFDDVYHTRAGALAQARHVFLGGNRLPARWQGRARFVVLETGFGLGHNFIATWAAWRADPARCERLVFVSIDKHPPTAADLARAHAGSAEPALCAELQRAWPPLTPDTHLLEFDGGRVRLLLVLGDIADALPDIAATVDAFYLDGFAPARNPAMWAPGLLQRLGRLAAPDATAATWSVAAAMRDALAQAGFEVQLAPGFGGKREITVARFAPRFQPRRPPGRQAAGAAERAGPVVVVGSGLAGAAAAWALARQGLACTVLEQGEGPAPAASGNAGGLFHGVLHADDAPHARWFPRRRAAGPAQLRTLAGRRLGERPPRWPAAPGSPGPRSTRCRHGWPAAACRPTMCRPWAATMHHAGRACPWATRPGSTPAAAGSPHPAWWRGCWPRPA